MFYNQVKINISKIVRETQRSSITKRDKWPGKIIIKLILIYSHNKEMRKIIIFKRYKENTFFLAEGFCLFLSCVVIDRTLPGRSLDSALLDGGGDLFLSGDPLSEMRRLRATTSSWLSGNLDRASEIFADPLSPILLQVSVKDIKDLFILKPTGHAAGTWVLTRCLRSFATSSCVFLFFFCWFCVLFFFSSLCISLF